MEILSISFSRAELLDYDSFLRTEETMTVIDVSRIWVGVGTQERSRGLAESIEAKRSRAGR